MGYWNYELCHWEYLRQYHEEKQPDGQVHTLTTVHTIASDMASDMAIPYSSVAL